MDARDTLEVVLARATGAAPMRDAAAIPAIAGAYLLLIRLDAPLRPAIRTLPPTILPPGAYVYAGSARGPGGLRARIARHLRRDKAIRWHVDHLSAAAREIIAFAVPGARECALCRALAATPRFHVPIPGFGSSDCRICPSHLLAAR